MATPTQFIEPGEVKLLPNQSLPLYSSGFGTGRFLHATKRETQTPNPVINPLLYSGDLPTRYAAVMVTQNL